MRASGAQAGAGSATNWGNSTRRKTMKLERNEGGRRGKYAVVRLREINRAPGTDQTAALAHVDALVTGGYVDFGMPGDSDEFFVVRLKDQYAAAALTAYAQAALADDPEYAADVLELAQRAAVHPQRKR